MSDINSLRLNKQGKQISQMISYVWRWADEDPQKEETQNARRLKKYFEAMTNIRLEELRNELSSTASQSESLVSNLVENQGFKKPIDLDLFRANPRDWLRNNLETPVGEAPEEVRLLIAVFGRERIQDEDKYLSPLFDSTELASYEFFLNPDSFRGSLEDPTNSNDRNKRLEFIIGYPPAPKFGEATVTESQLEEWIDDDSQQVFPPQVYIPVSTS